MRFLLFNRTIVGTLFVMLSLVSNADCLGVFTMMKNYISTGSFRSSKVSSVTTSARTTTAANYYWQESDFGTYNPAVAVGNPMKGLTPNPQWNKPPFKNNIPYSLEHYYVGLDTVMIGDNVFNWTSFETLLNEAKARQNHVIPRFFIHYPNETLRLPNHLFGKVKLFPIPPRDVSPDYNDPILKAAIKQFIVAYAKKYDGDQRIFSIQMGLIGFWGEWHTSGHEFLLSESYKEEVIQLFDSSFNKTQIQTRYPRNSALNKAIGFYDDSFTYSTLSGIPNGGEVLDWFFWNQVNQTTNVNFWKLANMGGETRPENQLIVFRPDYQHGTSHKQNFDLCTKVTHATWMLMQGAFVGDVDASYVSNALRSHSMLGYNYMIRKVAASISTVQSTFVDITVTIQQVGVAPFYYPLNLVLACTGVTQKQASGVEKLVDQNSVADFVVQVPATSQCLSNVTLSLNSPMLFTGKFVKLAQSNSNKVTSNGMVRLSIPLPITKQPTRRPTKGPTRRPSLAPTRVVTTMPLYLYNSNSNSYISQLRHGDTIITSSTGNQLSIVAVLANVPAGTTVGSVLFEWYEGNSILSVRERSPPYVLPGNSGSDYFAFQYLQYPGPKYINATAFSSTGAILRNRMINFTVA